MDKTLSLNILLGSSELGNRLVMLNWTNFCSSVFSVRVLSSELSSECCGNVPRCGLDTALLLWADRYSSRKQAQPGQCGFEPTGQSHNSGDALAAKVSQTSSGWSALILGASCGWLLAVPWGWNSWEKALEHSLPQQVHWAGKTLSLGLPEGQQSMCPLRVKHVSSPPCASYCECETFLFGWLGLVWGFFCWVVGFGVFACLFFGSMCFFSKWHFKKKATSHTVSIL